MTSHLKIPPAKVERALIDLIEVFTQPGPRYTLSDTQWARVGPLAGAPSGQALTMDELKTIRAHALANAQEWIESHNVNEALPVAIASKCLEDEPDPVDRIHVIASELEPLAIAWREALKLDDSAEAMQAAADAFNQAMEQHVPVLASITPNSESTLRMAFGPKKPLEVWFNSANSPYQFIRDLALHKSFNQEYVNSKTRDVAKELLRARIQPGGSCLSLKDAARAIVDGMVPTISATELPPYPKDLVRELFKLGVLEKFSGFFIDAFSTVGHIAYVQRHAPDTGQPDDFVFWPANRSRDHIEVTPAAAPIDQQQPEFSTAPAP